MVDGDNEAIVNPNMADGDSEVIVNPEAHKLRALQERGDESTMMEGVEQGFGDGRREFTPQREVDADSHLITSSPMSVPFTSPKMVLKPEKFEGKNDLGEYLSHFQDCAELGGWDDRSKCLLLAANLRGAARKYYDGLRHEEKKDYESLLSALRQRFGDGHLQDSWMTKLETRRRKQGESVSDFGDDLWRMTQRAYHDFDLRSQEQLALKHFYRVVDAEMKIKCIENKCGNIYDAVAVVERYEALYEDRRDGRRQHMRAVDSNPSNPFARQLEEITSQLQKLNTWQTRTEQALSGENGARYRQSQTQGGRWSATSVGRQDITNHNALLSETGQELSVSSVE